MRYARRKLAMSLQPALKSAVLALVLLAAETFAFGHPLDFHAHASDEPCKICISVGGLAAGAVGKPALPAFDAAAPAPVVATFRPSGRAAVAAYFARGPPHAP